MSISTILLSDEEKMKYVSECSLEAFRGQWTSTADDTYCCLPLPHPIYNPVNLPIITKILSIICYTCKRPILATKKVPITEFPRTLEESLKRSGKSCEECKTGNTITMRADKNPESRSVEILSGESIITNTEILKHFQEIKDDDLKYLGLNIGNKPSKLLSKVILCPPAFYYDNESVGMDKSAARPGPTAITKGIDKIYSELINPNRTSTEKWIQDNYTAIIGYSKMDRTEVTVKSLFDGKKSAIPELRTLSITGLGRCIINAGPDLAYNYVEIPRKIAENITIRIKVTLKNLEQIRTMHRLGFIKSVFASGVIQEANMKIEKGNTVQRHVMDGDVLLINRAPTLSLNSIMGFRIKIHDRIDMKIPILVCKMFNADFDGDEMNIIWVGTPEAAAELWTKFYIYNSPMDGGKSQGNVKFILNSCLAFLRMVSNHSEIKLINWYTILERVNTITGGTSLAGRWRELNKSDIKPSGRALMSSILPDTFNFNDKDGYISIIKGIVYKFRANINNVWVNIPGLLNSITAAIICQYENEVRHEFLVNMTKLTHSYLDHYPESMGYSDFTVVVGSTAKMDSLLMTLVGYSIKGKPFNIQMLTGVIPQIKSGLTRDQNQQSPFSKRGQPLVRYNNGSSFHNGQSISEVFYMSAKTREDILDSKGNVAKSGHQGNLIRGALADLATNNQGEVVLNGIPLGTIRQMFKLTEVNKEYDYNPLGPEFAAASVSTIGDYEDVDGELYQGIGNEDNEPDADSDDEFDN